MPGRVSHGAARLGCACQAICTLAAGRGLVLFGFHGIVSLFWRSVGAMDFRAAFGGDCAGAYDGFRLVWSDASGEGRSRAI